MEPNTKKTHFANLSDDDATDYQRSKLPPRKRMKGYTGTFCTDLREKHYGDVNF